jgi:hypothetical protein
VLCDDCAWNNVETWSLQWTRKRDEDVKMILRLERLRLVAEHPDVSRLAGLALDRHGTARACVRGEDVDASGVAEGDGSDESAPGKLACHEILTGHACEERCNLGVGFLGLRFHDTQSAGVCRRATMPASRFFVRGLRAVTSQNATPRAGRVEADYPRR